MKNDQPEKDMTWMGYFLGLLLLYGKFLEYVLGTAVLIVGGWIFCVLAFALLVSVWPLLLALVTGFFVFVVLFILYQWYRLGYVAAKETQDS